MLPIENNDAMNMGVWVSPQDPGFNIFGYRPGSGITGWNTFEMNRYFIWVPGWCFSICCFPQGLCVAILWSALPWWLTPWTTSPGFLCPPSPGWDYQREVLARDWKAAWKRGQDMRPTLSVVLLIVTGAVVTLLKGIAVFMAPSAPHAFCPLISWS